MQQSSALRRLEEILTEAVTNSERNRPAGQVLLLAMNLAPQPRHIIDFYELLNKAEEEARSIRNKPRIDRYIKTVEDLHDLFVTYHIWSDPWEKFAPHIGDNVLNTLDSLADVLNRQNPKVFLEQEFLENLSSEFSSLLDAILDSTLSEELKRFLANRIEEILNAIRTYHINGTKGLEIATKSLVSDLVMVETSLKIQDKENPVYRRAKAWILSVLVYIAPTPWDIVGAAPDIRDFWIPKFQELAEGYKKVEQIVDETPSIQEALEKAVHTFDKQPQKNITGKEFKALPASKEEPGVATN